MPILLPILLEHPNTPTMQNSSQLAKTALSQTVTKLALSSPGLPQWTTLQSAQFLSNNNSHSLSVDSSMHDSVSDDDEEIDQLANDKDLFPQSDHVKGKSKSPHKSHLGKKQVRWSLSTIKSFDNWQPVTSISSDHSELDSLHKPAFKHSLSEKVLHNTAGRTQNILNIQSPSLITLSSSSPTSINTSSMYNHSSSSKVPQQTWMTMKQSMQDRLLINFACRRAGYPKIAESAIFSDSGDEHEAVEALLDIPEASVEEQDDEQMQVDNQVGDRDRQDVEEEATSDTIGKEVDIVSQKPNNTANVMPNLPAGAPPENTLPSTPTLPETPPQAQPPKPTPPILPNIPPTPLSASDIRHKASAASLLVPNHRKRPAVILQGSNGTHFSSAPSCLTVARRHAKWTATQRVPSPALTPGQGAPKRRKNDKRLFYPTDKYAKPVGHGPSTNINDRLGLEWMGAIESLERALERVKNSRGTPESQQAMKDCKVALKEAKDAIEIMDSGKALISPWVITTTGILGVMKRFAQDDTHNEWFVAVRELREKAKEIVMVWEKRISEAKL
ncbi:unnamed protein product [Somion occarium]|uniref:Uncharacterized protein n=1 Tax=Somion occarium TaxID=3059160 RepID=A0ABP1D166_9APHY